MRIQLLFCFCLILGISFFNPLIPQKIFHFNKSWDYFVEEKGQFEREFKSIYKIQKFDKIICGLENADFNAYFTKKGIMFVYPERLNQFEDSYEINKQEIEREEQEKEEDIKKRKVKWRMIYFMFDDSNTEETILSNKCENYFSYDEYNYDGKRFMKCLAYKKVLYKNIYPEIDLEFYIPEQGGIKYQRVFN